MITLQAGDDRVVVDEDDGARLVQLVAGGQQRLVTRADATDPLFGHGAFVMAPWAGRIAGGRLHWQGTDHLLPRRLAGNAIHGLVDQATWKVATATADRARLVHRIAGPAPWTGCVVTHDVALAPGRLALRLSVRAASVPVPVAVGWHPCFRRPAHGDMDVRVPADRVLQVDDEVVPTGVVRDVAGPTDLRDGPPLGARRLDDTLVEIDGPVHVDWPDLALTMTTSDIAAVVVFTPPTHLCVEPQSAWPDPVRLAAAGHATGVATAAPGRTVATATTWTWSPRP